MNRLETHAVLMSLLGVGRHVTQLDNSGSSCAPGSMHSPSMHPSRSSPDALDVSADTLVGHQAPRSDSDAIDRQRTNTLRAMGILAESTIDDEHCSSISNWSCSVWTPSEPSAPPSHITDTLPKGKEDEPGQKPDEALEFSWSASAMASYASPTPSTSSIHVSVDHSPARSSDQTTSSTKTPPPSQAWGTQTPAQRQPRKSRTHVAECAVCSDSGSHVQWSVFNCGHCACETCAERLQECPMCRNTITSRIRLYL